MFRSHRRVAIGVASTTAGPHVVTSSRRPYTPIFTAETGADKLATQRLADEKQALWAPSPIVPSLARAAEAWLRFGNDPVIHPALPATVPPALAAAQPDSPQPSSSPFAYVEDYMGTNLVRQDRPEHLKESIALWTQYFEAKYVGRMRLSRRTAANVLGQVNAPEVLMDEADQPNTKWPQDTHFSELAFLCERHVKEKATTMEHLERAIWVKAAGNTDGFLAFFDAVQQQTQVRVPLPSPSVWFYEGESRKKWAEQYLPAALATRQFVETVLAPEVKRLGGGSKGATALLQAVSKSFAEVHTITITRAARQVKEGIRPDWSSPALSPAAMQAREAWCANELEREERGVQEGAYDPEDMMDSSEAWKAENTAMREVLDKKVEGASFTLNDFWLHMIRCEALETQHILAEDHFRAVAAAARDRMYSEGATVADVCKSVEESVAGGSLDLRAAFFRPSMRRNAIWCKLNYVKFGGSAVVHHTLAARRQLQYAYASSLAEIEAAATLYYDTKPLSTALDYSSPYKFRSCIARLCANYELSVMRATQMPFLESARHLSEAEAAMAAVVEHVAAPYGIQRRARLQREQHALQRLLVPVKSVKVCDVGSEFLETGADEEAIRAAPRGGSEPITMWPLGSRKRVCVDWPTDKVDKLRLTLQAGPMTAERSAEVAAIQSSCRIEISLWRRQTEKEKNQAEAQAQARAKKVDALQMGAPAFAEVAAYARDFFEATSREAQHAVAASASAPSPSSSSPATDADPEAGWVFACMLDDDVPLTVDLTADVYLPYGQTNAIHGNVEVLPQGEYVVRVRAYDRHINPKELLALTTESVSAPFTVFDALPQLEKGYFEKAENNTYMKGEELIPYCAMLREAGLDVPVQFEFAMGQTQDGKGTISLAAFHNTLRSNTYHRSRAERGITHTQHEIETRYRAHWMLYMPGASAYEWAAVRRRELDHAMAQERDWWLEDPLLGLTDVVTGSTTSTSTGGSAEGLDFATLPATARYALESSAVLEAGGVSVGALSATAGQAQQLSAACTVDGTGAITALTFGQGITMTAADVRLEDALATALSAVQHAQTRHATLAMSRTGPMKKQAQALLFCGVHGLPFGGKYARTYCFAMEKARKELQELTEVSGKAAVGLEDAEKARVSEQDNVDRYASTTHPEQRRTRFTERVTLSGQRMEDPLPDQTTSWNR